MSKVANKKHQLYREMILGAIEREARRPRTIVRICKKVLNQNQIVQILNELEKDGLVKRASSKAWIASK